MGSGSFFKALGRCKEPTPNDGQLVAKIEERIDLYRGDLDLLGSSCR